MEQRVEPAKKAAQLIHKKLQACMQSQSGLEAEKRMVPKHLCLSNELKRMLEDCYIVTFIPVSTEKAPTDAAVHQHGRESEGL